MQRNTIITATKMGAVVRLRVDVVESSNRHTTARDQGAPGRLFLCLFLPFSERVMPMTFSIRKAVEDSPSYPFQHVDAAIKLDQNESSDDFPDVLKAEVLRRLSETPWHRYPDLHAAPLRKALAVYEQWPEKGVVVTTGSNVLIGLISQIAGIGQQVVTVKPSFALYALDARLLGAETTEVPLRKDLTVDVAGLLDAIRTADKPGVIYLAQPQAPTGASLSMREIRTLAEASREWLLVLDEAYGDFSGTDCKPIATAFPHVIILRTLSKAWGLAGLRLGYALTSEHVAAQLQKVAPPFGVSVMQSVAAEVALSHPQYMKSRAHRIVDERQRVYRALVDHPSWEVFPSHANFLLIRTPDATKAFAALHERGILVRRQDAHYGLEGCIRVTIGTPHENDAFIAAAAAIG
jgi:histidinol-phosphate aminotransferase